MVEQYWEVQVYNQYVLEGNTAVLQCKVPSFVRDFVSITSWTQGHTNYYPTHNAGEWGRGGLKGFMFTHFRAHLISHTQS